MTEKKNPGSIIIRTILTGKVDRYLDRITDAVWQRNRIIAAQKLAELDEGDTVVFNHKVKPRYLRGVEGVVLGIDGDKVRIDMERPIRRYGRIIVTPPAIIDLVAKAN